MASAPAAPAAVALKFCHICSTAEPEVQWLPCGCPLCKDCAIGFLLETRQLPMLLCVACGGVVTSHGIDTRSSAESLTASLPTRSTERRTAAAATPKRKRKTPVKQTPSRKKPALPLQRVPPWLAEALAAAPAFEASTAAPIAAAALDSAEGGSDAAPPPASAAALPQAADDAPPPAAAAAAPPPAERPAWHEKLKKKRPRIPFDERVSALIRFKERYGHTRVKWKSEADTEIQFGLGEWVKNVRRGTKKITRQERSLLNEIGFIWETKTNRHDREWNERLSQLKAYKERFGDCMVPFQWSEDKRLSEWVHTQRKLHNKGQLRDDRQQALEAIEFSWHGRGGSGKLQAPATQEDDKDPEFSYTHLP